MLWSAAAWGQGLQGTREVEAASERNWEQPKPWLVTEEKRRVRRAPFSVCRQNRGVSVDPPGEEF